MAFEAHGGDRVPTATSPGGFEFGPQGFVWPAPVPMAITFFLDGSALVADQFGRPIKGCDNNGKQVLFAAGPPEGGRDNTEPYVKRKVVTRTLTGGKEERALGTHVEVVAALEAEGINWHKLTWAGIPQLPYDTLKKLYCPDGSWRNLSAVSVSELRRIPDPDGRKNLLRLRREYDEARTADAVDED